MGIVRPGEGTLFEVRKRFCEVASGTTNVKQSGRLENGFDPDPSHTHSIGFPLAPHYQSNQLE